MNVHSKLLFVASLSVWLGASCDGGEPTAPDAGIVVQDPCSEDSDCDLGLRCSANGACEQIPPCTDDNQCRRYEYCSVSEGICRTRDGFGSACSEDSECGLNTFCALGNCIDSSEALPCARRSDCPVGFDCDRVHFYCIESVGCSLAEQFPETACEPGELCNEATGRCQRAGAAECTTETQDEDCQQGMFCDPVGNCVQCISDDHCGTGLKCNRRSGLCESDNICRTDADCPDPENQICDPQARICIPKPDPCTSDLHCGFAERCDVVTGLCQPIGGPCRDDIYEDNDTFASATDVVIEGQDKRLDHLTLCPDDNDFYALRLNRGEELTVQALGMEEGAMLDLFLVAQDGISTLRYAPGPPRGPARGPRGRRRGRPAAGAAPWPARPAPRPATTPRQRTRAARSQATAAPPPRATRASRPSAPRRPSSGAASSARPAPRVSASAPRPAPPALLWPLA